MRRLALPTAPTIAAARRHLTEALRKEGFHTPALDARVLIGHALGLDHAGLIRDAGRLLAPEKIEAIAVLGERRLKREPIARIVGTKEFWSLPLVVNDATLLPRPETETVVEAALETVPFSMRGKAFRILDIGTGSGALLLALLSELPEARGIGTDISIPAVKTAQTNAVRLGLECRAGFLACDTASALRGPFDLVVSNPPYVPHAAIARLAPGVRDYEPHVALNGGPDGLDAYRMIAAQVATVLAKGGWLAVELGIGQAAEVASIFRGGGLAVKQVKSDLSGTPRVLTAVRI